MTIGQFYDVYFERTKDERHLKLVSLPGYTSEQYDGFLFERDDGTPVFVREFSKMVAVNQ